MDAVCGSWHGTDVAPDIVYSAQEASAMDVWLVQERGFRLEQLMAEAGARLHEAVQELCEAGGLTRVVWLVGPGNNGGDALAASELTGRALEQVTWRPLAGEGADTPVLDSGTLLVDGLFGVGLCRPLTGAARRAVEHVNSSPARVLAVDIPSGLSANDGSVQGSETDEGGVAVVAHHTLSFVGPKAGFFRGEGPRHVGRWRAAAIGFPVEDAEAWVRALRS
jgi:NAD(P)H-hydrate repair Nnr-like enzyme with NAD(P)H-hydrate epimerase domain